MFSIIMMNSFFNNLLNQLVREQSAEVRGLIAIVSFGIAMYCFANCLKVKYKSGLPIKVGHLLVGIVFICIALLYTFA